MEKGAEKVEKCLLRKMNKRGNGVKMEESWELLEEVQLWKEGRKMCGRRKKRRKVQEKVLKTEKGPKRGQEIRKNKATWEMDDDGIMIIDENK